MIVRISDDAEDDLAAGIAFYDQHGSAVGVPRLCEQSAAAVPGRASEKASVRPGAG